MVPARMARIKRLPGCPGTSGTAGVVSQGDLHCVPPRHLRAARAPSDTHHLRTHRRAPGKVTCTWPRGRASGLARRGQPPPEIAIRGLPSLHPAVRRSARRIGKGGSRKGHEPTGPRLAKGAGTHEDFFASFASVPSRPLRELPFPSTLGQAHWACPPTFATISVH